MKRLLKFFNKLLGKKKTPLERKSIVEVPDNKEEMKRPEPKPRPKTDKVEMDDEIVVDMKVKPRRKSTKKPTNQPKKGVSKPKAKSQKSTKTPKSSPKKKNTKSKSTKK